MIDVIPAACAERGIMIDCQKKFSKGAVFVLRVMVKDLDNAKLLTDIKGAEFAGKFGELMELLEYFEATDAKVKVEQDILARVHQGLMDKLVEILPPKLKEAGGVDVQLYAKTDAEQAQFSFDYLEQCGLGS